MIKRTLFITLASCLIFIACNKRKSEFAMPEFISEPAIATDITTEDDIVPVITPGTGMVITDSTIVIADLMDEKWLHEYDRRNGKLLTSYLSHDAGPKEVSMLESFVRSDSGWYIVDRKQSMIKQFDHDFNLINSNDIPKDDFLILTSSFLLPDGRMLAAGLRNDAPILEHGTEGLRILGDKCSGNMIIETPVDNIIEDNNLYSRKRFAFNADFSKLACGTLEGGVIETFNVDGNNLEPRASCLLFPYNVVVQNGMKRAINSKIGFSSIIADDNKIVAALLGDENPASPTDITVWDWNCKPLRKYTTNAQILTMAFSPDDPDSVYAVVVEDEGDPKIVTYRCPGLSECK
mgnify:CR=1 FL=1